MNVKRSIIISAPIEKVHSVIHDFHSWPKWSPWFISEPTAKINITENGDSYSWEGNRIGSGEMNRVNSQANQIDYDLLFLTPWKSKAKTSFLLSTKDNQTKATWTMDSKLPFYLFFMKKKMEAFIGNDYDRGLAMLKEYVETGEVNSKVEVLDEEQYKGTKYVGIKRDTTIEGMKQHMGKDFEELMSKVEETNGQWFSIYHKFDFVKEKVSYTACVGVNNFPDDLPEDWIKANLPKGKRTIIRHTGPYEHLGNAWATAMLMIRNKEFKPMKKVDPMEFYVNSPKETEPKDLISDVSFMVK